VGGAYVRSRVAGLVALERVEGLPLVGLPSAKLLPFSRTIKRALDPDNILNPGKIVAVD